LVRLWIERRESFCLKLASSPDHGFPYGKEVYKPSAHNPVYIFGYWDTHPFKNEHLKRI
jgi:hypothetical protein